MIKVRWNTLECRPGTPYEPPKCQYPLDATITNCVQLYCRFWLHAEPWTRSPHTLIGGERACCILLWVWADICPRHVWCKTKTLKGTAHNSPLEKWMCHTKTTSQRDMASRSAPVSHKLRNKGRSTNITKKFSKTQHYTALNTLLNFFCCNVYSTHKIKPEKYKMHSEVLNDKCFMNFNHQTFILVKSLKLF